MSSKNEKFKVTEDGIEADIPEWTGRILKKYSEKFTGLERLDFTVDILALLIECKEDYSQEDIQTFRKIGRAILPMIERLQAEKEADGVCEGCGKKHSNDEPTDDEWNNRAISIVGREEEDGKRFALIGIYDGQDQGSAKALGRAVVSNPEQLRAITKRIMDMAKWIEKRD